MTDGLVTRTLRSRRARLALGIVAVLVLGASLAPWIAPYDPITQLDLDALKLTAPTRQHWFGTDDLSRDLLSRIMYGARISLAVAGLSVALSITAWDTGRTGSWPSRAESFDSIAHAHRRRRSLAIPRLILLVVDSRVLAADQHSAPCLGPGRNELVRHQPVGARRSPIEFANAPSMPQPWPRARRRPEWFAVTYCPTSPDPSLWRPRWASGK